jgi:hypothetical protein
VNKLSKLVVAVLALAGGCWAQSLLTVQVRGRQHWPAGETDRLYLSACSAVEREFGGDLHVRPRVTLVLGADRNEVHWDRREIRLIKWDPYLFTQGVVVFAFEDLMPTDKRLVVAKRAMNWADSTVDVHAISK